MTVQINFQLPIFDDGVMQIALQNPTSISGWTIQWDLMYRANSPQPIISRYLASGYYSGYVSGISLVNGTTGIFNIQMLASDLSGLDPSNYYFQTRRTDVPMSINTGWRLANN